MGKDSDDSSKHKSDTFSIGSLMSSPRMCFSHAVPSFGTGLPQEDEKLSTTSFSQDSEDWDDGLFSDGHLDLLDTSRLREVPIRFPSHMAFVPSESDEEPQELHHSPTILQEITSSSEHFRCLPTVGHRDSQSRSSHSIEQPGHLRSLPAAIQGFEELVPITSKLHRLPPSGGHQRMSKHTQGAAEYRRKVLYRLPFGQHGAKWKALDTVMLENSLAPPPSTLFSGASDDRSHQLVVHPMKVGVADAVPMILEPGEKGPRDRPTISGDDARMLGSMIVESKDWGKGGSILESKRCGEGGSPNYELVADIPSFDEPGASQEASVEELHGLGMLLSQQPVGLAPPPSGSPPSEMSFTLASDLGRKILQSRGLSSGELTQSTCTPTLTQSTLEDLDKLLEMDSCYNSGAAEIHPRFCASDPEI